MASMFDNFFGHVNPPPRIKIHPWTIGGTLFLGPQGWISIRAVVKKKSACSPSFSKQKGGGLLFGHGTNKEGGLLLGGGSSVLCLKNQWSLLGLEDRPPGGNALSTEFNPSRCEHVNFVAIQKTYIREYVQREALQIQNLVSPSHMLFV